MPFRPLGAAVLLVCAACTPTEEVFLDAYADATCAWEIECFEMYDSVETCRASEELDDLDPDPACTYDGKIAKECLDAVDTMSCSDDTPAICAEVYDCDATTDS